MADVLLATRNPGKLNEYESLLVDLPLRWRLLSDIGLETEVEETGATFEENARLKALTYARESQMPTLADDSGLAVDALDGAPGVRSARYAGPGATDVDRYRLLLKNLDSVPDERRGALFVCVTALALPGGDIVTARGEVRGRVLHAPQGQHGFGYDPVFWVEELNQSMAELSTVDKNRVSHRARALAAIRPELVRMLGLLGTDTD